MAPLAGKMRPLEGAGAGDEENQQESPRQCCDKCDKCDKDRGPPLAWWFGVCCFCYSAVGLDMAYRLPAVECSCPAYPWEAEAFLLLMQGLLSFLHDAHFAGRSRAAKAADRSCATFLTLCQPLKFSFCRMDSVQLALLLAFWALGLLCFRAGGQAFAAKRWRRYQVFHTLWHIALPMGGFLWIEYTRGALLPWKPAPAVDKFKAGGMPVAGLLWGGFGHGLECGGPRH